jgi:hypothetical protein
MLPAVEAPAFTAKRRRNVPPAQLGDPSLRRSAFGMPPQRQGAMLELTQ